MPEVSRFHFLQKKKGAKSQRVGRRIVNQNVIREKLVTKNHVIDIATIEENVTESVTGIEKLTVTRIVNASAREKRRVTANQRVTEGVALNAQMKNERIRAKLKNPRANEVRRRKQLVNDTPVWVLV